MSGRTERAAEWVYRGIWRGLSGWFMVPENPPALPADGAGPVQSFHPSRRYLDYLKLYFWIGLAAIDAILIAGWVVLFVFLPVVAIALAPVFLVLIVVPDIVAYVMIHLRYDTLWYVMSDRSLRCRSGIWLICEHTITFENIQDIHVRRGPVQQLFGISSIIIETAGSSEEHGERIFTIESKAVLEGIDNPDEIRGLIMERVRRSRAAGLGDEWEQTRTAWLQAETPLLREIRDELRAIA